MRTFGFNKRAFTLIEMIGVLAIIATLASIMIPSVIRQVDRANATKEESNLRDLATAHKQSILRTKTVPTSANMPSAIATEANLPVIQVVSNAVGVVRAFLVDPSLQLPRTSGGSGLPYTQTSTLGLSGPPNANARVMIVSSLSRFAPLQDSDLVSANFNNMWDTPDNIKPTSWGAAWKGTGYDLKIQRVNLAPLFHHLILVNHDNPSSPNYCIDSFNNPAISVDPNGVELWLLDGTVIGLDRGLALRYRHILTSDTSLVFVNGAWQNGLGGGNSNSSQPDDFANSAADFLISRWNDNAYGNSGKGADQITVLIA